MSTEFYDPTNRPPSRQRRPANKRDDAWIKALLQRGEIAHLATRWDEQVFQTPTSYWYDEERQAIYIHSNIAGRLRANIERHTGVCLEVSEYGRFLASNDPLEASVQYRSVIVFGTARVLTDSLDQVRALEGLLAKYFPQLAVGREIMPIGAAALARTSVYAITIDEWSGKENWADVATQTDAWPALESRWLEFDFKPIADANVGEHDEHAEGRRP